jgi:hypothetical protein
LEDEGEGCNASAKLENSVHAVRASASSRKDQKAGKASMKFNGNAPHRPAMMELAQLAPSKLRDRLFRANLSIISTHERKSMKQSIYSLCTGLMLAALIFSEGASAEEKAAGADTKKAAGGSAPDMEEMMKKMQAFATPGAGHKLLEPLAGEWNVESRTWMAGPEVAPTASKGTTKVQWILGGRYLKEEFSGEMMQQPFQGVGITAYDNFKKKYVSTWIDTMGTGIFTCEGTADDSGKTITLVGKMDDPTTGEKDKPTKCIIRIAGPDKHTFEMHDLTLGEKSKVFEITYTRKQ